MVKDVDDDLLRGSINRNFIVKVRPFSSAKTIDMEITRNPPKETSTRIYTYYMWEQMNHFKHCAKREI